MPLWRQDKSTAAPSATNSSSSRRNISEQTEQSKAKGPEKSKMPVEEKYRSISLVLDSWEQALELPDFEEEAGAKVLIHLFELEPATKSAFGLKPRFIMKHIKKSDALQHAVKMLDFLDYVLNLVGAPETLYKQLQDVGRRHKKYGISPEHIPLMGKAVRLALKDVLPAKDWSDQIDKAWEETFTLISSQIVKGMEDS